MLYLVNAFSFNMVNAASGKIDFFKISKETVKKVIEASPNFFCSAIGHEDTATMIRNDTNCPHVCFCRMNVNFRNKDEMIVAQYKGPRLPDEGAKELPEGATIEYYFVIYNQH